MKKLICTLLTAALIAPAVSFAQTSNASGPVTRAEVRAELVQLERAGYRPGSKQIHYPDELQAAEQRVQASNNAYASQSGVRGGSTATAVAASSPGDIAN